MSTMAETRAEAPLRELEIDAPKPKLEMFDSDGDEISTDCTDVSDCYDGLKFSRADSLGGSSTETEDFETPEKVFPVVEKRRSVGKRVLWSTKLEDVMEIERSVRVSNLLAMQDALVTDENVTRIQLPDASRTIRRDFKNRNKTPEPKNRRLVVGRCRLGHFHDRGAFLGKTQTGASGEGYVG